MSDPQADLWVAVRLMAEGSDWKRDEGETLTAWAQRKLRAARPEVATLEEGVMDGVREYAEQYPVVLEKQRNGRLAILAKNEGGYNGTAVDLLDLLEWISRHRPQVERE